MTEERTDWSPGTAVPEAADDPEAQVDAITAEIEVTRGEMDETVEAIGDRLDPRNVIEDAKGTVREATVGKVEQMASSATDVVGQAGDTAQQAGAGVLETLRRNPIPAAMTAFGLAWLWTHRSTESGHSWQGGRGWSYADSPRYGSERYGVRYGEGGGQDYGRTGGGSAESGRGTAESIRGRASETMGSVGESASHAADSAGRTMQHVPDQLGSMTQQTGDTLGRMIDDNPLGAGAVALAVGTAIGLALPETRTERRVLGPASQGLIERAGEAVQQPLQEMEQQAQGKGQGGQGQGSQGQGQQPQGGSQGKGQAQGSEPATTGA